MPLNLASPGIVVKEFDLTLGRTQPSSDKVAALVAPFAKGPVDQPTLVENENDLLAIFGEPYSTDKHYENWLVASSYLAYGGSLRVVRANDNGLRNGFVGTASSVKIDSLDHYNNLGYDENTLSNVVVSARNPGSWSNGIRVAIIDAKADQILGGISTSGIAVGYGITQSVSGRSNIGIGTTSILDGYLKGIVTGIGNSSLQVKILNHISSSNVSSNIEYPSGSQYEFQNSQSVVVSNNSGVGIATTTITSVADWFDQQTIGLTTSSSLSWNNIAPRPGTSAYAAARNSRFDEVHVVVIDSLGAITGNAGNILEKHIGLSKATDATFSVGSPSYWRKYIAENSSFIFALNSPSGIVTTGFSSNNVLATDVAWDQPADGVIFAATGSNTNEMSGGKNYGGFSDLSTTGSLSATLSTLSSGLDIFESTENYKANFLLMGSGSLAKESAQALANKLISVAELRKDSVAFISPYRGSILTDTSVQTDVTVKSAGDITDNLISFYSSVTSSTYGVFDSGYKYMYDRFANTFRYVPLNGDIAGLCARTDINNFPWYSPAYRGSILNAVKLAYNPTKVQRDRLYSNRINPVIVSPGAGITLFGDKTAYAKASAFDRINVRRLFIYLEDAISRAAQDALFQFNDEVTRTNFVNTIEPFLRDVQAKRGIYDYIVICDETNNTAAVIDNNEFIADIYIKPARTINYIGLNFIATKTGVSFEEVIGNF
jgi:hypothetical protein